MLIINYLLINSIQPKGVHGMKPDVNSPVATRPSLIVQSLLLANRNTYFLIVSWTWFHIVNCGLMFVKMTWEVGRSKTDFIMQCYQLISAVFMNASSYCITHPSTSLDGSTASVILWESILLSVSKGICTMTPWTLGSVLSLLSSSRS